MPDIEKFLPIAIFKMDATNRKMLNLCGIVVAILKMAIGRNFPMAGINLEHHNLSKYEISMKSDNVEYLSPFSKWPPQ
jgi:hypothetical protein